MELIVLRRTGGEERTRLIVWRPPTKENIILTEASHLVRLALSPALPVYSSCGYR